MNGAFNLALAPQLPWIVLAPLMGLAAIAVLAAFLGRGRGRWWRLGMLTALILALFQPSIVKELRDPVKDVAVVVVDRSPSQGFADRAQRADAALTALNTELARFPDLETRVIESDGNPVGEETDLFAPRADALSDIPRDRLAGTFLITDGEVHDAPKPASIANQGPIHLLLTGAHDERDRRIEIADAPGYGIVGGTVAIKLRIVDSNIPDTGPIPLKVVQDGGTPRTIMAPPNGDVTVTIPIPHGGPTTVELEAAAAGKELTQINNHAVVVVNGVRERLRVLLISGEPHAGERTWRNLLKADPSVDLTHFTILRPPDKNDGTPFNELSLIQFPVDQLFNVGLHDYDLIIFDHYQQMLLLPEYYQNLANYVRRGGALMEASGPGFEGSGSLYHTALRQVLPAAPTGREINMAFKPQVTEAGDRHPVTSQLPGDRRDGEPDWGRWFRQGEVDPGDSGSSVVMTGAENKPLLMLGHAGEGRVAQLASDQIWLWSRGYEGGGPQGELLKRLAHWLMKEPELEENQLTAGAKNRQITIARRSLEKPAEPVSVTVTNPDGTTRQATLEEAGHGIARATVSADSIGLYKVSDGVRTAFAVIGSIDTPELRNVLTTDAKLKPVVEASGGGVQWLADGDRLDLRRVDAEAATSGRGWLGLRRNGRYTVRGVTETPLLPVAVLLILLGGMLAVTWYREGR
ncbi:MAG TPA: glutamine amidotransferase [Alphaproteobacteria bacterium]|nr:glutamine amidotransferase [Alphaproteobacteria bacterium]